MPVTSDRALAKFLGNVYTHVFQRVERNPNRPLNKTSHIREQQQMPDEIKSRLITGDLNYVWGSEGLGDETLFHVPLTGHCEFDATTTVILITDQAAIQNIFDSGGTIEAWIHPKSDGEGSVARITDKGTGLFFVSNESNGFVRLRFNYQFSGTDGTWRTIAVNIPINQWTHVAVVYNNSSASNVPIFYVNGVVEVSETTTTPTGTRDTDTSLDLRIGNNSTSVRTWDGFIDDVRLWSDIRTPTEILDNYQVELIGTETGLVGYWQLNDTSGTNANDETSNNNDGTLSGGAGFVAAEDISARWGYTGVWG